MIDNVQAWRMCVFDVFITFTFDTYRYLMLIKRWTQWIPIKCHYKHQCHERNVDADGDGVDADDAPLFFVYSFWQWMLCVLIVDIGMCFFFTLLLAQSILTAKRKFKRKKNYEENRTFSLSFTYSYTQATTTTKAMMLTFEICCFLCLCVCARTLPRFLFQIGEPPIDWRDHHKCSLNIVILLDLYHSKKKNKMSEEVAKGSSNKHYALYQFTIRTQHGVRTFNSYFFYLISSTTKIKPKKIIPLQKQQTN